MSRGKRSLSMSSFAKAYELFNLIVESDGDYEVSELAHALEVPQSSIYRHMKTLKSNGMLVRLQNGQLHPGPGLLRRLSKYNSNDILADITFPYLRQLRRHLDVVVHFGVLEDDMVTYLVKIDSSKSTVFTREGEQLEAYCSGIGKALLAHLPPIQQQAYLASGPFPRLTASTITDPSKLATELKKIKMQAYAVDNGEIRHDIFCLAVPVFSLDSRVVGAVSVSQLSKSLITKRKSEYLAALRETAGGISSALSS